MRVEGKAVEPPSFLWFTRGGKAYLVTDATSLARLGEPPHSAEVTLGERLRDLADEMLRSGVAETM